MQPATDAVVQGLEAQIEAIRQKAENDMAVLFGAIEIIQGRNIPDVDGAPKLPRSPRPPAADGAKTIPQMIEEAANALGDVVLEFAPLREKAQELHPAEAEKIKRGIYPAVTSLTNQKKLVKVQGGWKLPQFVKPGDCAGPAV